MAQNGKNIGKIVQVIGSTLDAEFDPAHMPHIYNGLQIQVANKLTGVEQTLWCEVAQHIGDGTVRAIALGSTDGFHVESGTFLGYEPHGRALNLALFWLVLGLSAVSAFLITLYFRTVAGAPNLRRSASYAVIADPSRQRFLVFTGGDLETYDSSLNRLKKEYRGALLPWYPVAADSGGHLYAVSHKPSYFSLQWRAAAVGQARIAVAN